MLLPIGDKRDIHRGEKDSRHRRDAPEGPETMLGILGFLFKSCPCAIVDRRGVDSPAENTELRELLTGYRFLLPGDLYVGYVGVNSF
jgi:hypothetical protein